MCIRDRARAGLRDYRKPVGSYLFAGPTGVGKTEAAKQLADTLGVEMIRFDMSDYMERHTVSRLIGAPPGYVGFDQGGLLTDAIDQHPHCVLLLDEIEKAHPVSYTHLDVYKRQLHRHLDMPFAFCQRQFDYMQFQLIVRHVHHGLSTCLLYTSRCV